MRIFVTGATGFVGEATVRELLSAGHEVLGLARNDAGAEKLTKLGAEVHRGDLHDIDSLVEGARKCDGVAHLAFNHDFSSREAFLASAQHDGKVVEAMLEALKGTNKPFVGAGGGGYISPGRVSTEDMHDDSPFPRAQTEKNLLSYASKGVRASTVRLAATVHGAGETHAFIPMLIKTAREKGYAAYIGDGANRWPAVHRADAARLYRLALEKGPAGSVFHGVAEEGIAFRAIAETIGAGLGLPVKSIPKEEVGAYFGFLAMFAGVDAPSSSAITREKLGWQPQEIGLIEDMKQNYFK